MLGLIPSFLSLEIETLSPRGDHFLEGRIVQLGKGGMDPLGGGSPPEPPCSRKIFLILSLRNFGVWAQFWLKKRSVWARLGGFLSERRPVFLRSFHGLVLHSCDTTASVAFAAQCLRFQTLMCFSPCQPEVEVSAKQLPSSQRQPSTRKSLSRRRKYLPN